jgi:ligand-binding sensor domain-containing protein/two-component sensor histidine kinase
VVAQIEPNLHFRRYGIEDGLSQVTARCILEDKVDGYMWIGTQDGLNQFDGYTFKVFRHSSENPTSISHNRINVLFQDIRGKIWIGTGSGLNIYIPQTESFSQITLTDSTGPSLTSVNVTAIAQEPTGKMWIGTETGLYVMPSKSEIPQPFSPRVGTLSDHKISALLVDSGGDVWIGTNAGLNKYDSQTDAVTIFKHSATELSSISSNDILSLFEDNQGELWIGTSSGLNLLDKKKEEFSQYTSEPSQANTLTNDDIRSIAQDDKQNIWVGTRWGGINILNKKTQQIRSVMNQPGDQNSLSNNTVLSIIRDSRDNMWVGVSGTGLNIFNPRTKRFKHYKHIPNNPNSLLDDGVWGILKDHMNKLWVGTYEGISVINTDGTITHYRHDPADPRSISSNQVTSIYQDRQQRIWIGTIYGLNRYDPVTNGFIRYTHKPSDKTSLSHDLVWCIYQDSRDRIWLGTDEGGLNQIDPVTAKFIRYPFNENIGYSSNHFRIKCIIEDKDGQLWLGTDAGVNVLNPKLGTFRYFKHDPKNSNSLPSNSIKSMALDMNKNVYVGTEGGLSKFNPNTGTFKIWKEKNGLSNDVIYGILTHSQNEIWLSTNKGINRLNTKTGAIQTYYKNHGLQSDEFNTGAYYVDKEGRMYFGGVNGLSIFHPDSILLNKDAPRIVLTDLQLFNRSVSINDSTVLPKSLNYIPEIILDHTDEIVAFTFAAISYEYPDKIKYAYKLEPFHNDWIYTNYTDRKAVLTRIPAGKYTFRVNAANEDGIWSESSKDLSIVVLPPWHKTTWARALFLAIAILLIILVIHIRERNSRRIRIQLEKIVSEKTQQLKAEKEEVSKQLKEKEILMQEVHHRVKNNLTFLKGLLYLRAKASTDHEVRQVLNECQARIESMALVHQNLYDMDDSSSVNFEMFLRELFIQLLAMMEIDAEKIDLELDITDIQIDMKTSVFLGLILNELITNSFKYAFNKREGSIHIHAFHTSTGLEVHYSDSGPGLKEDYDFTLSEGFGFKMIRILNNQLGATIQYVRTGKKKFLLSIPKQ